MLMGLELMLMAVGSLVSLSKRETGAENSVERSLIVVMRKIGRGPQRKELGGMAVVHNGVVQ